MNSKEISKNINRMKKLKETFFPLIDQLRYSFDAMDVTNVKRIAIGIEKAVDRLLYARSCIEHRLHDYFLAKFGLENFYWCHRGSLSISYDEDKHYFECDVTDYDNAFKKDKIGYEEAKAGHIISDIVGRYPWLLENKELKRMVNK